MISQTMKLVNYKTQPMFFFEKWIQIGFEKAVTNYFHIIGSSHLVYWLKKLRNLSKYSNHNWEHMNKRTKHTFLCHTQRRGDKNSSQLLAVARYYQQMLMCNTNIIGWVVVPFNFQVVGSISWENVCLCVCVVCLCESAWLDFAEEKN